MHVHCRLHWLFLDTSKWQGLLTHHEGTQMCTALNYLTRLECLELDGHWEHGYAATFHLQLPQLRCCTFADFGSTTLLLHCPQLKALTLSKLDPLQEMSGLPDNLERLHLANLGVGSVPVEQMLQRHGIKNLLRLEVQNCPGDPRWQNLSHSLEHLALWLPLDEGIPWALEQLTRLTTLRLSHMGRGPMHLTRPLDPFLDMASLVILDLETPRQGRADAYWWTPAALGLLGLADSRVLRMQDVPGGRVLTFSYT